MDLLHRIYSLWVVIKSTSNINNYYPVNDILTFQVYEFYKFNIDKKFIIKIYKLIRNIYV